MSILESFRYKKFSHNEAADVFIKEVFRKSIHITAAAVPFFAGIQYTATVIFIAVCAAVYSCCEFLRLKGFRVPVISSVTNMAARKRDAGKFVLGPVTLCAGILLSLLLFPAPAAKAAIITLAAGDGFASLAGKAFGRTKLPFSKEKTFAGSFSCFSAVFLAVFFLTGNFAKTFAVALTAAVTEALPFKNSDNILIPLAAGIAFMLAA